MRNLAEDNLFGGLRVKSTRRLPLIKIQTPLDQESNGWNQSSSSTQGLVIQRSTGFDPLAEGSLCEMLYTCIVSPTHAVRRNVSAIFAYLKKYSHQLTLTCNTNVQMRASTSRRHVQEQPLSTLPCLIQSYTVK